MFSFAAPVIAAALAVISFAGGVAPSPPEAKHGAAGPVAVEAVVTPGEAPAADVVATGHGVTVIGGTTADRAAIAAAVGVFEKVGLELPYLELYIHGSRSGCASAQGLFNADGSGRRIDLCAMNERLILHELAHAWAHHSLTAADRDAFVELTGLPTWNDHDFGHAIRATEVAADAISFGLSSSSLSDEDARRSLTDIEYFVFLTGEEPPRLDSPVEAIAAMPDPTVDADLVSMYSARRP